MHIKSRHTNTTSGFQYSIKYLRVHPKATIAGIQPRSRLSLVQGRKCGVTATFSASLLISSGSELKNALRDAPLPFPLLRTARAQKVPGTQEACKHPRPSRRLHSKTHHKKTHSKAHHKNVLSTRDSQKDTLPWEIGAPREEGGVAWDTMSFLVPQKL